jgi:D-alanyl-D-alanine dipeptidase
MFLIDAFLKQSRRDNTHNVQVTPNKATAVVCVLIAMSILLSACHSSPTNQTPKTDEANTFLEVSEPESPKYTEMELELLDFGLVDIAEVDSTIGVELVYATPDNFLGHVLYPEIHHAFAIPAMAEKLVRAQERLKAIRPDLSLLIYDAARPLSVQREMWESVKGTPNISFVANPAKGRGMHNYGAAVDITIMDSTGTPLPMGSKHDYFGPEARIDHEDELLASGLITQEELANRKLLRRVMTESGFITCVSEWWHFNHIPSIRAKSELKIIDL